MKKIYVAGNLPDAYLLRDLLGHAGVPVHIFNEFAQGGLGDIPFTHAYPEIWIEDERDEKRALQLVEKFDSRTESVGQIKCPACGESNPAAFELCWQCGKAIETETNDRDGGNLK